MTYLISNVLAISWLTLSGSFLFNKTGFPLFIRMAQNKETQFKELSIYKPTYS